MPQKHEIYVSFYSFSNVCAEKFLQNILQEMKNGMSLRQQQLQVIMYYIIICHEHFISSVADKRMHIPRKNEQCFYFSLTLKDTEIFPKLLF